MAEFLLTLRNIPQHKGNTFIEKKIKILCRHWRSLTVELYALRIKNLPYFNVDNVAFKIQQLEQFKSGHIIEFPFLRTIGVQLILVTITEVFIFPTVFVNCMIMYVLIWTWIIWRRILCSLNHSTVVCVYIQTINHYMNEGSDVYSCLIDASKVFDRAHWGTLYILIEKKVSHIFLCLIFDSCIRQKVCAAWGIFRYQ